MMRHCLLSRDQFKGAIMLGRLRRRFGIAGIVPPIAPVLPVPVTANELSPSMYDIERVRFFEEASAIETTCRSIGRSSQTTKRFREAVLHFLLDNPASGPIIEVGTLHGGMTALLGLAAERTGRHVYAVDLEPHRIIETQDTCRVAGVSEHVTTYCGVLSEFLPNVDIGRPDLIFLDSDHSYNVTRRELSVAAQMRPKAIALHDFNYRQGKQEALFADLATMNPVSVDFAVNHFIRSQTERPIMVRVGAHADDGTVTTYRNRGGHDDFIPPAGTEGAILIWS